MSHLPTIAEIFDRVYDELDQSRWHASEAASWMRSDWSDRRGLTDAEVEARKAAFTAVGEAKAAIDRAKSAIDQTRGS